MGALLYELVTGQPPFKGESDLQIFANVMTKPPVPVRVHLKAEAAAVEPVLLKCLRRKREDRYPTMSALATALRSAIA
jgi:serine/threonine-protein kinase